MARRQIIAVRLSGGDQHRHIAGACYIITSKTPYEAYTLPLEAIVKKLDEGEYFFTRDYKGNIADVVVVRSNDDDARYIRTKRDGKLTDNLLYLPRYERDDD